MKNKKGLLICSIIGAILIIVGILLWIFIPKESNKELYASAFKKSLGLVAGDEESLGDSIKTIQEKLEKSNYKVTINGDSRQDEAGYSKLESVFYLGKDKAYFTGTTKANDMAYVIEAMLKDDKLYFNIKDVLDNIYYIDKISEFINDSEDSLTNKLADFISDAFLDALDNKNVTIGSHNVSINGKTYKTTLHSYSFTGETLYDFVVSLVKKIQDDKDIYKDINKFLADSGMLGDLGNMTLTRDQINEMLNQVIQGAEALKQLGSLALYNIYMYNDEPILTEISVTGEDAPTIKLYNITENNKRYTKLEAADFVFEYNESSKGNGDITVTVEGKKQIEGYVKESNGSYELKLQGVGEDSSNYVIFTMKEDHSGTIKVVSDTNNINLTYKVEKVDSIPDMDVSGSKPYENASSKDKQMIEAILGMFFQSKKNEIDYDYDYDFDFDGLDM